MYTIATLNDLRWQLNLGEADTDSDADLLRTLEEASHLIESLTQRRYCPIVATRQVSLDPANPHQLILPDDLLELHSISDEGGAIAIDDIRLKPSGGEAPASVLELAIGASFLYNQSPINAVTVSGVWGWHDRWSDAWRDSGDAVRNNTMNESASAISVNDSEGSDEDGYNPRFQVGHLLRIEEEYLRVVAIDRETHQLTALRGVSGTTATAHAVGASIETYVPALTIRDLTLRYAELMLQSIGLLDAEANPLLQRMRRLTV